MPPDENGAPTTFEEAMAQAQAAVQAEAQAQAQAEAQATQEGAPPDGQPPETQPPAETQTQPSAERERLNRENRSLAAQIGARYDDNAGRYYRIINGQKEWLYHTGGIAGNRASLKDNEVLSILENGEMVLDENKKRGIYRYVDLSSYLVKKFGEGVRNIGSIFSARSGMLPDVKSGVRSEMPSADTPNTSYTIGNVSVTAPIQVVQKLDDNDIKRCSRTIGAVAARQIKQGFTALTTDEKPQGFRTV